MSDSKAQIALLVGIILLSTNAIVYGSNTAKSEPLFDFYSKQNDGLAVSHFGPVGIGIEWMPRASGMRITNVEEGSPADATGKLKIGKIIVAINGQTPPQAGPRIWLGDIVTEAEAGTGVVALRIMGQGDVNVRIPVLGRYSETWPLNCEKSNRIVRNEAEFLAKQGNLAGASMEGLGLLFMLSTGEKTDLEVARSWVKELVTEFNFEKQTHYAWHTGYGGIGLCEYYLRTGDKSVIPVIESLAASARLNMYDGSWGGRGGCPFYYMGGGHMNAAGVHVVTFLLLAKECGAEVDEYTLQTTLKHFFRYAGRGNTPYGDSVPEPGFVDNGKTGGLAFTMAAAASLTPGGEASIYAKARDICAIKNFYAGNWLNHGHTGGGIGEIWRNAAMGLMYEKHSRKYREFMDQRRWFFELSRHHDGSIGIVGGEGYNKPVPWGIGLALSYTIPRKTLRITGMPKTRHSNSYQLPSHPWGTPADEEFLSIEPAVQPGGTTQDLDAERFVSDSALPVSRRLAAGVVSDELLLKYAHHPDHGIRRLAANASARLKRDDIILKLLKSSDARVRQAGTIAVYSRYIGAAEKAERGELTKILKGILNSPEESWWVTVGAIDALAVAAPDALPSQSKRLLELLNHDEWWLQAAAAKALCKVAADETHSRTVLPALVDLLTRSRRYFAVSILNSLRLELASMKPDEQNYAKSLLREGYRKSLVPMNTRTGLLMTRAGTIIRGGFKDAITVLPGGRDIVMHLPMLCSKWQMSKDDADLYIHDGLSRPNPKIVGKWEAVGCYETVDAFDPAGTALPRMKMRAEERRIAELRAKMGDKARGLAEAERKLAQSRKLLDSTRIWAKPFVKRITIKDRGKTDSRDLVWSGDMIIDLETHQALKVTAKTLGGVDFIFIENGGFAPEQPNGWHPGFCVMTRMD